jgi:xanthine/uracil permease
MSSNKKPSKPLAKVKNALLSAVVVMALYTIALFLPNLSSIIALLLGVLAFWRHSILIGIIVFFV